MYYFTGWPIVEVGVGGKRWLGRGAGCVVWRVCVGLKHATAQTFRFGYFVIKADGWRVIL